MARFMVKHLGLRMFAAEHDYKSFVANPGSARIWPARPAAQMFCDARNNIIGPPTFVVVEVPECWRVRQPETDAEWEAMAKFFDVKSGKEYREQVQLADEVLAEVFAEEGRAG